MRRIAIASEKGGTAKTTTAINLAAGLAKRGRRVLAVDLDPQANLSLVMLGGQGADPPTVGAVLLNQADASEAIRPTGVKGLDILPADVSLADANLELTTVIGRERRLRVAMEEVRDDYDFAILDTSPQRSVLTVNALVYASEVIVPIDPGLFAVAGLGQLQAAVEDVRRYLDNRELHISGLLLTRAVNSNVARDVESQLRGMFGPLVFSATVPNTTKVEEAHSRFQSVLDYAPKSPGAKAYAAFVEEVINGRAENRAGVIAERAVAADDAA